MRMKKTIKILLSASAAVCALLGFAACNRGGEGEEQGETPHVHQMQPVTEQKADCTHGGHTAYFICNTCEKWFGDAEGTREITDKESVNLAPLDHDWDEGTTITADCTNQGVTTFRCQRAGCVETKRETTEKLGHDIGTEWTQAVHTHYHACSRCNLHEDEEEHRYSAADDSVCEDCGNIVYDTAFTFFGKKADGSAANTEAETVSYAVGAYTGSRKRVMIPLKYKGKPITAIEAETFMENHTITAVSIPSTVENVWDRAFYHCTALIDVELQGGVSRVGAYAFEGCTSLQNVTLSGKISSLGYRAFQESGLRAIHFPETLTEIGENAFAACENLTEITIPSTVTSVGRNIFLNCTSLETVNFLASVESIGNMMFDYCPLKKVTLSPTIKSLEVYSFAYTALETVDFLPEGLLTIGNKAFIGCTKLKSVQIPSTCTSIMPSAFRANTALETVTGGGNVEQIGMFAFYNCVSLKKIGAMPELTAIGDSAFDRCGALSSFSFGSKLVSVGKNAFRSAAVSSVRLASSVKTLGEYAFAYNTALSELTIGSGLESVGLYAFYGCTALKTLTCDSLIGYGMFRGATSLQTVTLGAGVTKIDAYAFYECAALTSVTFERSLGWTAETTDEEENTVTVTPAVSSDGAANAALLNQTYCGYVWTR